MTDLTFKRFLPCMGPQMSSEVYLLRKTFMADLTFKRFLPCMDPQMSNEACLQSKTFIADVTFKPFVTGVSLLVLMEVRGSLVFISISTSFGAGIRDNNRNCRITSCREENLTLM